MKEPLIHISWLELKPNVIEHGNAEWFEDYYSRIKNLEDYRHIPESVFKQWIHPHHRNYNTLSNYAWMNFKEVKFLPTEVSFEALKEVYVVEDFRPYVESRGNYIDFEQFCCIDKDLEYWKENGTWRVPPIILDNSSLKNNAPAWSEIKNKYQLVEGHSRIGYLFSMKRISQYGKGQIAEIHKVWIMKL